MAYSLVLYQVWESWIGSGEGSHTFSCEAFLSDGSGEWFLSRTTWRILHSKTCRAQGGPQRLLSFSTAPGVLARADQLRSGQYPCCKTSVSRNIFIPQASQERNKNNQDKHQVLTNVLLLTTPMLM